MTEKEKSIRLDMLFGAIQDAVEGHPKHRLVKSGRRDSMAASLTGFVIQAIDKYYAGQKAHGGDIIDRDLAKEIQQEQIDLYWYTAARSWKESEK